LLDADRKTDGNRRTDMEKQIGASLGIFIANMPEKMIVEKQMECRLAGQTEVLGENLPQRHFCPPQNPT
jgi:hypothetical protein